MRKNQRIYYIGAALGVIGVILVFFSIYPLLKGIRNNSENIVLAKKELAFLKNQIEEIKDFQKVRKTYKPNLEKLDNLFIDAETPLEFIQFLEEISSDSNIVLEISSIVSNEGKEKKNNEWESITFRLLAKGNFGNFMRFLEKLENSPYLIQVQDLSVKELSQTELRENARFSTGDIRVTFSVKVFTR